MPAKDKRAHIRFARLFSNRRFPLLARQEVSFIEPGLKTVVPQLLVQDAYAGLVVGCVAQEYPQLPWFRCWSIRHTR